MSFPRYPSYKDSGVELLGDVPAHWHLKRFKHVFKEREERSVSGEELLLSVSAYTGVSPRSDVIDEGDHLSRADSLEGYKLCYKDDLVVNIMLAWNRGLAVTAHQGIVSPAYCVYFVIDGSDPRFLNYLVRSNEYTLYFKAFSSGVIDSRLRIYPETFGRLFCGIPPLAEQTAIAEFLDRETGKIDELVAEQRRLMELLKEKRQAVISHAVTRGLNPAAPLKPSGIEWLGDVPAHWQVVALKHLVSRPIIDGPHETPIKRDEGIPFVSAEAVSQGSINFDKIWGYISPEDHAEYSKRYKPKQGDILLVKLGATTGTPAIVETDDDFNIWVPLAAIRPKAEIEPRFILHVLRSDNLKIAYELNWTYGTQQTLGLRTISNLLIPMPPKGEREAIVKHLDSILPLFESLTAEAQRAIDLLQERRTALISAAVTGQIDVRADDPDDFAIVLRLPPVAAEPPLLENRINGVPEMQRFWETCDPMDLPENPDVVVVMDWLNRMAEVGGFERSLEHLGLTHQDVVDQVLQPAENDNLKPLRAAHPLVLMQCLWRIGVQIEINGYDDMRRPILSEKHAAAGEFWRELRKKLVRGPERPCLMFATAGR